MAIRCLFEIFLAAALVGLDGLLIERQLHYLVIEMPWIAIGRSWACVILFSVVVQRVISRVNILVPTHWFVIGLSIATGSQLGVLLDGHAASFFCAVLLLLSVVLTKRFPRPLWGAILVATWVASTPSAPVLPTVTSPNKNQDIVVITIDTVREDALSSSPRALIPDLTPNLDALAKKGCRIDQASSTSPLTGPSHAAMFSGLHPIELGLFKNGGVLPADIPWLPQELHEQGYQTAAFVSSAMLDGDLGYRRGFGIYDDDQTGLTPQQRSVLAPLFPSPRIAKSDAFSRFGLKTIAKMDQWLATTDPERPVFVWLHLYDAHRPYVATKNSRDFVQGATIDLPLPETFSQWKERPETPENSSFTRNMFSSLHNLDAEGQNSTAPNAMSKAYLAGVRDLDGLVRTAWERLDRHRSRSERVWALLSDHGESLTEHGELGSHQFNVYEANIRVPFFLSPGDCPQVPISTINLGHFLIGRAHLPIEWVQHAEVEATVKVGTQAPHYPSTTKVSQRMGNQKLIAVMGTNNTDHTEHYDLANDRHEMNPLPASAKTVQQFLDGVKPRLAASVEVEETTDSVTEALRALGYLAE